MSCRARRVPKPSQHLAGPAPRQAGVVRRQHHKAYKDPRWICMQRKQKPLARSHAAYLISRTTTLEESMDMVAM